jgi:dihydrofolate synthase / folylpolyglutamate synthase
MTYADAVAFLQTRINYEVTGLPAGSDLRLGRMTALLGKLGDPHRRYRVVHVAGTKGKGSTATMIAELLHATGAKVGLHLSPHFERIEERMRVGGELPTPERFASVIASVANAAAELDRVRPSGEAHLTFFEITSAAAFEHFAQSEVDWAVVEVGVGGRLDATNVVSPAVSVIAEIGLDHTKTLGETIAAIAAEKAGIIKPETPVLTSATSPEAIEVIQRFAERNNAPLKRLGRDFSCEHRSLGWDGSRVFVETWKGRRKFNWRLLGAHQGRNAALAWATFDLLAQKFNLKSPPPDALNEMQIPGRMEVIQREPFVVLLDVAHNEPSAAALAEFLRSAPKTSGTRVLVFAASRDKNWPAMLDRLVDLFDVVVVTQYQQNARAVPVAQLADRLKSRGLSPIVTIGPQVAWRTAVENVAGRREGLICIAGSFFLAAEIRPQLLQTAKQGRIE